jgi:hypothetical protein
MVRTVPFLASRNPSIPPVDTILGLLPSQTRVLPTAIQLEYLFPFLLLPFRVLVAPNKCPQKLQNARLPLSREWG